MGLLVTPQVTCGIHVPLSRMKRKKGPTAAKAKNSQPPRRSSNRSSSSNGPRDSSRPQEGPQEGNKPATTHHR